jgi:hypothetical protein
MSRKKSVQSAQAVVVDEVVVDEVVVDEANPVDTEQDPIDAADPISGDVVDDQDAVADAKNFKTNHNGLFVIDDIEFKEDEVKELYADQLESKRVQHAIEIGVLIEA